MSGLSEPVGVIALAAAAIALLALIVATAAYVALRRIRAAQKQVLGEQGSTDLVAHAAGLQQAFVQLHDRVEELADQLERRVSEAEDRLDGAIAYRALVRYDAYGELSGHQSSTIALLDAEHNGVVLTSITHREAARMYCKQIIAGNGELELSPEESEAVRLALAGEVGSRTLPLED